MSDPPFPLPPPRVGRVGSGGASSQLKPDARSRHKTGTRSPIGRHNWDSSTFRPRLWQARGGTFARRARGV